MRGGLNLRRVRSSTFANFPSQIRGLPSIHTCLFSLAVVLRTNCSRRRLNGLDVALAKVESPSAQIDSPLAIGNPGDAMLFSVTKGLVSIVGKFPYAGKGTGF